MSKFLLSNNDDEVEFMPILPVNEDEEDDKTLLYPTEIPVLALRNTVLFPNVVIPITIGRDKSLKAVNDAYKGDKLIAVLAQKDVSVEEPVASDLVNVGTVAKIIKLIKMPDGGTTIILQGKQRFTLKKMLAEEPYFKAEIEYLTEEEVDNSNDFLALISGIKDIATEIIKLSPNIPSEASIILKNIEQPNFLINFVCGNLNSDVVEKQLLLEINNIKARAEQLMTFLNRELQFAKIKDQVTNKTRTEIDKQQRDYFLQQQMKSIKEELGGENGAEVNQMRKKAESKNWPEEAKKAFETGIEKLERMHPSTPDYSVVYNHLDLLLDLPWNEVTEDHYDLVKAKKILDNDHYGMDKIKDRILEHLAVLKLKGDMKSPILCFVGPPGIGKTSLGKSIAHALGRKYIRQSLGGLHDESEIRGHRKTYIGAMPGRIIQSIRKAKTSNPVMVLDELDKLGSDHRTDPSSALLEVLDPEQNSTFYDNYLELEYDLSKVLFIATANTLSTIQPALRDRLEIIDLSGYAIEEKVEIAKRHLVPKQKEIHGLSKVKINMSDSVLEKLTESYTRESGVRDLDRQIANIMRHLAKEYVLNNNKIKSTVTGADLTKILGLPKFNNELYKVANIPGVAVGLAWTYVGGDILFIEASVSEGKGELQLTGNLGQVMKESANAAFTFIKSNAKKINIDPAKISNSSIHVHVPEGATPKDGPSAGITMLTAITSALTGKKVKPYLAMTGEITLRGQVLPVGGIKEKVLAAKRSGMKEIVMCWMNEKDVNEIEPNYIQGLTFHYVKTMNQVLDIALFNS
ncbi:endopeptidase La [Polluticaenibacter yanchengensis]|uniref:Lon protease n=1 Tax=Polluticaenibacter yanchengensis TaxID=3014562 RepID=A0ABT4UNW4_9BACT|nr:endopeptidase La [Chitinophagaceae bacterium LY-5]